MRTPTAVEVRQLHNRLQDHLNRWQRRRAEAIVLYASGMTAVAIAQMLEVHPNRFMLICTIA
jgi:hypothetical protein